MASLLDAWQTSLDTPLDFTSFSAGSNRCLVIVVGGEDSASEAGQVTGVDVGGQAATLASDGTNDANVIVGTEFTANVTVFYLLDAEIDAATDAVITPSFSGAQDAYSVAAAVYEGINQAGGTATTPEVSNAESASSTPNPLNASLTGKADGDLCIAAAACGNVTTVTWGADFTERTEVDTGGTGGTVSAADHLSSGTGTITAAPTWGSQNRAVLAAVRFAAAVAALSAPPIPGSGHHRQRNPAYFNQ